MYASISGAISVWLSSGSTHQPGAQFGQLLAGLHDGGFQAGALGTDIGGLDFLPVITASGSVVPNTGPIATPAETAMP